MKIVLPVVLPCSLQLCYIGFKNSVSTASSFRWVSAKRRPGGTLCFFFQSKGHTICKKGIVIQPPSAVSCQQHAPGYIRGEQLIVWHSAAEPQLKRVFPCSPVWYPPIPSTLAIPTERKASARSLGARIPKRSIGMWEYARS